MADYIINDNETIFANQINNGWLNTFKANKKLPVIAKRLFATYASAKKFVDTSTDTAIPGLVLSVFNDPDPSKNGIYFVKQAAGVDGATVGILEPAGAGAGSISVNTYADALKEIKVDATTQEVKNLGQVIYIKTATGTVGQADYKPAGAYVVTGATTLEKLGTSISGDLSSDVAGIRTDLGTRPENTQDVFTEIGGLKALVGTTAVATQIDNAIKDLDVEDTKENGKYVTGVTQTDGKITAIKDTLATSLQSNNTKPITSGAVYTAFDALNKAVVKSIKSGNAEAVTPVDGVATITYDAELNENSTNAPQTNVVYNRIKSVEQRLQATAKGASVSVVSRAITAEDGDELKTILKRYTIYQGEEQTTENVVGTIDIPKDLVVTSGELVIGDGNNGTTLGVQYLKLNIGNGEPVYIKVGDLVDAYVEGEYLSISEGNVLSVDIDAVDAKLAEDESAVGGRIKAVEEDVANVVSHTDEELGKLVADRQGSLSTLVKKNKDAIKTLNDVISVPGSVANKTFEVVESLIEGVELNGSKSSLYQAAQNANSALQEIRPGNENQLTVAEDENDSTIITLTPVVAVLADLEEGTNPEKLLTAGVAKEYIDNKWDWEIIA